MNIFNGKSPKPPKMPDGPSATMFSRLCTPMPDVKPPLTAQVTPRPRPEAPPMPPVPPAVHEEVCFLQLTNAELADAINWTRDALGKVPGGETKRLRKREDHLYALLDIQLERAKRMVIK